jgi:inosine/xanthosine triphosphate pyrophosphatase family protein/SAM-dependent methyltransferase
MKILIATHNKQKLFRYRRLLSQLPDLEVLSLDDLRIAEKVEENFSNNIENAKHKARFYGDISGLITLGIDEAVLTDFLPDNEQPGVYVRRFSGDKRELGDDEVIEVWKEIFKKYPQEDKKFIFDYAIAYYDPQGGLIGTMTAKQVAYVADKISDLKSNGYPLSRILTPEKGGRSYAELRKENNWKADDIIFSKFISWIKKQQTIDIYNKNAPALSGKFDSFGARVGYIDKAFSYSKKNDPFTVEIGCANGRDAKEILEHTDNYLGIDVSQELIGIARQNVPGGKFQVADVEGFDFPPGMDIVFAFASLIHSNRDALKNILDSIAESLNSGGIVYLSLKHGKYGEYAKEDEFGIRIYYYYDKETMGGIVGSNYEIIEEMVEEIRGQEWLEVLLRKT